MIGYGFGNLSEKKAVVCRVTISVLLAIYTKLRRDTVYFLETLTFVFVSVGLFGNVEGDCCCASCRKLREAPPALKSDPPLAKVELISVSMTIYLKGKNCWAGSYVLEDLLLGRALGLERDNYADTRVSEEGMGEVRQSSHCPLTHGETAD